MLEEHVSLGGELDAPGASGEEGEPQAVLQFSDGLGDGRLADVELLGGLGDIAGFGYLVKYFVLG
mgnify:CR=1 FL=1